MYFVLDIGWFHFFRRLVIGFFVEICKKNMILKYLVVFFVKKWLSVNGPAWWNGRHNRLKICRE